MAVDVPSDSLAYLAACTYVRLSACSYLPYRSQLGLAGLSLPTFQAQPVAGAGGWIGFDTFHNFAHNQDTEGASQQASRSRQKTSRPVPLHLHHTRLDSIPYLVRSTALHPSPAKHSVFRACADAMPSATTKSHQCDPRQERSCTVPAHWRELLKYQVPSTCYKYSVLRAPCLWALGSGLWLRAKPCCRMGQLLNCSTAQVVHRSILSSQSSRGWRRRLDFVAKVWSCRHSECLIPF